MDVSLTQMFWNFRQLFIISNYTCLLYFKQFYDCHKSDIKTAQYCWAYKTTVTIISKWHPGTLVASVKERNKTRWHCSLLKQIQWGMTRWCEVFKLEMFRRNYSAFAVPRSNPVYSSWPQRSPWGIWWLPQNINTHLNMENYLE